MQVGEHGRARRGAVGARRLGGDKLAAAGCLAPFAEFAHGVKALLAGRWLYQRQCLGGNRPGLERNDGVEPLEIGDFLALAHSSHVAGHPVTPLAGRFDGMEVFSHRSSPTGLDRYVAVGSIP